MSDLDLMFQLFGLLLGLAVAELLMGLARSWRIRAGAIRTGDAAIRIGWLVPMLGLLFLIDQTHFWLTAHTMREHVVFNYATLLAVLALVGGYFVISTFVFPDEPADWPDFDEYYLHANRTVIGGMFAANLATFIFVFTLMGRGAFRFEDSPIATSWFSLGAMVLYLPGLATLWFVKSKPANLALLGFMNLLLLTGAIGPLFL